MARSSWFGGIKNGRCLWDNDRSDGYQRGCLLACCRAGFEGGTFELFGFFDFEFEGFERGGDLFLIVAVFGFEMQADAVIDVGSLNTINFFQGHTDLFVCFRSSGAGHHQLVGCGGDGGFGFLE